MRGLPLIVCTLLLQVPAKADKFWLSDPAGQKDAAAGSSPSMITGVLIAESDEGYHVRIVGGEVILPKKAVFKIEKDDLSIDTIVKTENEGAQARETANREREMAQTAAKRERDVKAVEAAARRSTAVPATADRVEAPAVDLGFDPVIGVAHGISNLEMQRDLQLAFSLTQDRRYLKMLRQLRRLN